jgi:hypothetical protein
MANPRKRNVPKFFSEGRAAHPIYEYCLREPMYAGVRDRIETLWVRYEPICPDLDFVERARTEFVELTWQMYLACVLMDHSLPLRRPGTFGPDIWIDMLPRIWVEAVAVGAGDAADRVPDREARAFTEAERGYTNEEISGIWHGRPPSEETVILRITSALDAKYRAYERYLSKGIVKEDEPYVVALNLAGIEDSFFLCNLDEGAPVVVQALFGIGAEHLSLAGPAGGRAELRRGKRPVVTKSTGAEISARAFASLTHRGISGVLATCTDIVNVPLESGREIMYVNNPSARAPLVSGIFPFGMEFHASDGEIERRDHRPDLALLPQSTT